jgi:hypothetical protein
LPVAGAMRISKEASFANSNQRPAYLESVARLKKSACEIENLAPSKRAQAPLLEQPA